MNIAYNLYLRTCMLVVIMIITFFCLFFTEWFLIYQLVRNFDLEYVGFKDQQSSIYQLCEFSWTSQRCADHYWCQSPPYIKRIIVWFTGRIWTIGGMYKDLLIFQMWNIIEILSLVLYLKVVKCFAFCQVQFNESYMHIAMPPKLNE